MKICNKCGCEKKAKNKNGFFCKPCRYEYQREWTRNKKDRKCEYCHKEFVPISIRKFCCEKCVLLGNKIEKNGCWEWKKKKTLHGYGETSIQGKSRLVHRLSYEIFKGKIPEGKNVCHSCDNKICFNPDHLWIGTQKENIEDCIKKERWPSKKGIKKT